MRAIHPSDGTHSGGPPQCGRLPLKRRGKKRKWTSPIGQVRRRKSESGRLALDGRARQRKHRGRLPSLDWRGPKPRNEARGATTTKTATAARLEVAERRREQLARQRRLGAAEQQPVTHGGGSEEHTSSRATTLLVALVARVRPRLACASPLCFAASGVCQVALPPPQPAAGLLL